MPKCLICENSYQPFVNFGEMPIANAFGTKEEMKNTNENSFMIIFELKE